MRTKLASLLFGLQCAFTQCASGNRSGQVDGLRNQDGPVLVIFPPKARAVDRLDHVQIGIGTNSRILPRR